MTCTPSSSAYNRFSVLHVDSIPKIKEPVESPPVVPPKTNPPAPSRKWKPNWEKRIPDHLVIDTLDEKEGRRRSLTLKIELQTTHTAENKSVTALLDSGATGMFIDREYVKKSGFTTRMLSNPIPVRNVDGTPNEAGSIMDVVELNLRYRNHAERVFFAVTNLGKQNVIMGHTWLQKHNPDINWVTGDVKMSCCSGRCCSGCRDEICEERRERKIQARRIADCSEGEIPDLDRDDEDDEDMDVEIEDGDRIFATGLHQPPEEIRAASTISQRLAEAFKRN